MRLCGAQSDGHLYGHQGVTSQGKEVVMAPDTIQLEQLHPESGDS
ncbi:hypothetical protein HDF16_006397, partial [Granulicella aggregans]|nr:hypothetical protein [Granulicella aggregans]